MALLWAETALLPDGWARDVRLEIDDAGRIASVTPNAPADGHRTGCLLPAPVNSHSHAFQRALAGLTEKRGPAEGDSFWTWRQLMFRFLDQITPDQAEAIAAFVQMEMLEAGYATNVEFHYLHHQPGGTPYDNLSEMSARIAAAAETSGIGLTLLPVHYQFGGCDGRALGSGQIRFGNDPERFAKLVDGAAVALNSLPADTQIGVAPHSLRAVGKNDFAAIAALSRGGPVHMHLAEQKAEVAEVESHWGARPVNWALDNLAIDRGWCLIHCTQMEPAETTRLAQSGAVAGLCPLTEASLGDGIFDGMRWVDTGGALSIGSDSNIRISLAEELRQLDTSQRLRDHSRAPFATPSRSSGRVLFDLTNTGGAQAAGRASGQIAPGNWADLMALDTEHVDLAGLQDDTLIDSFIFTGDNAMVRDVWSAGRHLVQDGQHIRRGAITRAYRQSVAALRDGL